MTRTETIHELNEERKRKELLAWQKFLAADGKKTTAERLQERTTEIERARDEYAKALLKVEMDSSTQKYLSETPEKKSQGGKDLEAKKLIQKQTPNDDVLKGAENLPQNRPDLGINRAKNIDGIQNKNDSENTQKPGQSTQNRSNEIREAQQEQGIEEQNEFRQNEESALDDQYLQEALSEIESVLAVHDIDLTEFLKGLPGYSEYEKLQSIIAESKNVQYTFPVFLLATATLVDIIEWINLAPGAGLITLVILSVIKYTTLVPILIISTFGDAGIVSKMIMKRILFRKAEKKGFFLALSPLAEFIPLIGSFWPGTLLFYLWLTNAKTTAGLILVELAKIVNKVPGDISK